MKDLESTLVENGVTVTHAGDGWHLYDGEIQAIAFTLEEAAAEFADSLRDEYNSQYWDANKEHTESEIRLNQALCKKWEAHAKRDKILAALA